MRFSLVLAMLLPLLSCGGDGVTGPGSEPTLRFTGHVLLNGEPVEGVEVRFEETVFNVVFEPETRVIDTTTSDSEGVYHLAGSVPECRSGELDGIWRLIAVIVVDVESGAMKDQAYAGSDLRCVEEVQVFDFEFIFNP